MSWQDHFRAISEAHALLSIIVWLGTGAAITLWLSWHLLRSDDVMDAMGGFTIGILGIPIWVSGTAIIGLMLGIVR